MTSRVIEGVKETCGPPEYLILDGQQRLTSIFRAAHSTYPVETTTDKGQKIYRYYYLDINKCLDDTIDRLDAIVSIPEDRKIKTNFNRDIVLNISTREHEYNLGMFPINIIFDSNAREDWADGYKEFYKNTAECKAIYKKFRTEVLDTITGYKLPVITLDRKTPREAICKIFENVNTGGIPLTVFELVTATFAAQSFDLREDWEKCKETIHGTGEMLNTDVMCGVDETDFLTAITLYTSFKSSASTSCKRKDVLALSYEDYKKNKPAILEGFKLARKFLLRQFVFRQRDLPYTTQLIPLSAICAAIGESTFEKPRTSEILTQWYWCGVLGEMYGGANETRYANDIDDVVEAIRDGTEIRTINAAFFSSTRLLTMQTRLSAAYKGVMALIYKEGGKDFLRGTGMDVVKSMDETPDIHHIFPESWCKKQNFPKEKWNSIVNKTPLLPATNRSIGGNAPSIYSKRIMESSGIDEKEFSIRIQSNLIDYYSFMQDDFNTYFTARAKRLLNIIENAMHKKVADKGAEQTIKQFGTSLED